MKGMIFAAGLGTRLQPLTLTRPKALVAVGGEPMLGRVMRKLVQSGVRDIVVNVHHFPDMIRTYLRENSNFGANVTISDETELLLDTGGGVRKALDSLCGDEPVLLHNADILTDFPIREMLEAHEESGADATLLVSDRTSSRGLLFDAKGKMSGWTNVKTGEVRPAGLQCDNLDLKAFGGVHIIGRRVLEELARMEGAMEPFSIIPFYVERCRRLDIRGFEPAEEYQWFDIGRPETLEKAQKAVEKT